MDKLIIIFGTRPEFIKLIPVIIEIKKRDLQDHFIFIYTNQHSGLHKELFNIINFTPDYIIPYKDNNNSLAASFSHILGQLQIIFTQIANDYKISMVIAQGDTTTAACAAFYSVLNKIPFGHIEAGLRTYSQNPFPEEYYRRIITLSTEIHFAPTTLAANNLISEGVNKDNVLVTGNTIVDTINIFKNSDVEKADLNKIVDDNCISNVLITCHRRENQTDNFEQLIQTIKLLASSHPAVNFIWITHYSPFSHQLFENDINLLRNIKVVKPLHPVQLYKLYEKINLIITDSGGIQEEACSFNIPVIVIRENTERIESIHCGYSAITGCFSENLVSNFEKLINLSPVKMHNPYGDGRAAKRIVNYLQNKFTLENNLIKHQVQD